MNKTLLTLAFMIVSNISSAQVDKSKNGKHRMGNQGENFIGGGTFFKKKYELEGRTLLNNPFSDSLSANPGRIILNITVDSLGNVVNVSGPARGSSTEDSVLVSRSKISAYKAKFNASSIFPTQNGKISFMYFKK